MRGSSMWSMRTGSGMSAGLCISSMRAVGLVDAVDDRGGGGDQVEVELALEPVADHLEVQQAEEAAAEAEAERGGGLHLGGEGGVVELELLDGVAQRLEVGGVDREEAAEDHGDRGLEAGERVVAPLRSWVMVSPTRVSRTCLIEAVRKPISPGPRLVGRQHAGAEGADAVDAVERAGLHHPDAVALAQRAVEDADEDDDAEVGVVPAVDQHRLQRRGRVAARGRGGG